MISPSAYSVGCLFISVGPVCSRRKTRPEDDPNPSPGSDARKEGEARRRRRGPGPGRRGCVAPRHAQGSRGARGPGEGSGRPGRRRREGVRPTGRGCPGRGLSPRVKAAGSRPCRAASPRRRRPRASVAAGVCQEGKRRSFVERPREVGAGVGGRPEARRGAGAQGGRPRRRAMDQPLKLVTVRRRGSARVCTSRGRASTVRPSAPSPSLTVLFPFLDRGLKLSGGGRGGGGGGGGRLSDCDRSPQTSARAGGKVSFMADDGRPGGDCSGARPSERRAADPAATEDGGRRLGASGRGPRRGRGRGPAADGRRGRAPRAGPAGARDPPSARRDCPECVYPPLRAPLCGAPPSFPRVSVRQVKLAPLPQCGGRGLGLSPPPSRGF